MSFILFIFILLLFIGIAGTSAVFSLIGKIIRGVIGLLGFSSSDERIERHRSSWKEDDNQDSEENKLDIRTEEGLRRIKKMKDSAETTDFEEIEKK
ncbi:MAG: DUF4834 family protein [Paludibacteraceae bacterium]|nr:DUF4834 family protein [Paludibacteraceae bacterium]